MIAVMPSTSPAVITINNIICSAVVYPVPWLPLMMKFLTSRDSADTNKESLLSKIFMHCLCSWKDSSDWLWPCNIKSALHGMSNGLEGLLTISFKLGKGDTPFLSSHQA
jgi:hypothetical protein